MLPLESVQRVLSVALQNGGDLAELYLENSEALTLTLVTPKYKIREILGHLLC